MTLPLATAVTLPAISTIEPAEGIASKSAAPQKDGLWVPLGQTIQVGSHILPGGVYVGRQLRSLRGWDEEAALINPGLKIDDTNPDWSGSTMGYWPSYASITPEERAAYLIWMARGKDFPDTYIGYVFLYFYGLERRVLHDAQDSTLAAAEIPVIREEVARLLRIYGGNRSFQRYASSFLQLIDSLLFESDGVMPGENYGAPSWTLPLTLLVRLGVAVSGKRPIDHRLALLWWRYDPRRIKRTAIDRCEEEFEALFELRYRERFGEGLRLAPPQRRLTLRYTPASASFGGGITPRQLDLPDVSQIAGPITKLNQIAEDCAKELGPLSRYIGRTGERPEGLSGLAVFPSPLASRSNDPALRSLLDYLDRTLDQGEIMVVPGHTLLHHWTPGDLGPMPDKQERAQLALLDALGYGVEPDLRHIGAGISGVMPVVIFRHPSPPVAPASDACLGAMAMAEIAMAVATADGDTSEVERKFLEGGMDLFSLNSNERRRVEALLLWREHVAPVFSVVSRRLSTVPTHQREVLGEFLVALAAADGHVGAREIEVLRKTYQLLSIDEASLYGAIHTVSMGAGTTDGPVTVRVSRPTQGFVLPPRPADPDLTLKPGDELVLNAVAIAAKLHETARVASLLETIFADEPAQLIAPQHPSDLDERHWGFLNALLRRSSWPRAEAGALAKSFGLPLEGALDTINDAAFEKAGGPATYGDDEIVLDQEILQEMLA